MAFLARGEANVAGFALRQEAQSSGPAPPVRLRLCARQDAGSFRSRKLRIRGTISSALSSSAKWPVSIR